MVSIDDVARRAGVSTATVSRALSGRGQVSDAARSRVRTAASALGYVTSASASSLASGRTRNIGVLVPAIDPWFFTTVITGIAGALLRRGYDTTLYNLPDDAALRREVFDNFLRRRRVDGVLAITIELADAERDRLGELGLPVLALGGPNDDLATLSVDDVAVGRLATEHLLALGHHDIAHIGTSDDSPAFTGRRRGFDEALAEAVIAARPERVVTTDITLDSGFRAATELLARPGAPTAIFAGSDEIAIGAIVAARGLGIRVPDDLSVIGVDGHDLGAFFGLTTVDQFPRRQGERAADAIVDAIEAGGDLSGVGMTGRLPFELTVRGSTAPPGRATRRS